MKAAEVTEKKFLTLKGPQPMLYQIKNGNWIDLTYVGQIKVSPGSSAGSTYSDNPAVTIWFTSDRWPCERVSFDDLSDAQAYRDELAGMANAERSVPAKSWRDRAKEDPTFTKAWT